MKVLFVSNLFPNEHEPARGIFNLRQMQHLARRCDVRVVAPIPWFFIRGRLNPALPVPAREQVGGLETRHPKAFYLPVVGRALNPWLYNLSTRGCIEQVRREFPFDVIYVNWAYPDACGVAGIARRLAVPFVVSISGSDANRYLEFRLRRRQILTMLERSRAITVRSRALKDLLMAHGVPADKIHVLYNGVDGGHFALQSREDARGRLGLPQDERVVVYVGRLSPEKGVAELVEALQLLTQRHAMSPRLVVVGDGVDRAALSARAATLGVESMITWLGWKPPGEVAGIVAAADLLCLPSHMEGVPNAALEAFACGRPVVATRVGGIPEVITTDTGVLADPRAPESLATALHTALSRTWDADAIRAHAARFDWAENARQLQGILEKAVVS